MARRGAQSEEEGVKPLAVDLYCGLGGWTTGLLGEGYEVLGFDIEQHVYGQERYPAQLVVQDVLTLHGRQFKDAALIVASPPCQEYSYMAMPWSRAKQIRAEYLDGTRNVADLTRLFDACFRIQREACEAAGKYVPMVVENVRGAQEWVGRSRWNFGSFHLWGDVPALMPMTLGRHAMKAGVTHRSDGTTNFHGVNKRIPGQAFNTHAERPIKNTGASWFNVAHNTTSGKGRNPVHDGVKQHKSGRAWFADPDSISGSTSSKSQARKRASAMIAKIPLPLSRWIGAYYHPMRASAQNASV